MLFDCWTVIIDAKDDLRDIRDELWVAKGLEITQNYPICGRRFKSLLILFQAVNYGFVFVEGKYFCYMLAI